VKEEREAQINETLQFVAQKGWSRLGEGFPNALARHLGKALDVDYVVIDKLSDQPGEAETVAVYAKGNIVPNMRYVLAGTPCENVFQKRLCCYASAVQRLFPDDKLLVDMDVDSYLGVPLWDSHGQVIGLIAAMDSKPLGNRVDLATKLLQIVAARAAAELEGARSETALKEQSEVLLRANASLRESEARIRRLVDANIIGVFIFDVDGPILQANDAFLKIIGYSRDDLASGRLSWIGMTPPEWQEREKWQLLPELQAVGTLQPFEKEYFRKDGSRVPVLIGVAMFGQGGKQGVAFVLDLTERKHAEEALRDMQTELAHANRVITMGHLAASIAHEVKQPITAVVANASAALNWLEAQPPNLDEARRALGEIVQAGLHAGDVVGRIQALVRKTPPRKQPFDFNEAIVELIALTRAEARNRSVSLFTDLSPYLPAVEGDRTQIQQVVLNLILNAMEAMSGNGEEARVLRIATGIDGSNLVVTVEDSGPGFQQGNIGRMFEAFYTTKPAGVGMGLSISRSIVEGHGGRLWANTKNPHGAVFQFSIPMRAERAA